MSAYTLLNKLEQKLDEALKDAELAYSFSPSSYTHSAFAACKMSMRALEALREKSSEAHADMETEGFREGPTYSGESGWT